MFLNQPGQPKKWFTLDRTVRLLLIACCLLAPVKAQQGAPKTGEWPYWGGDSGSTRFSPLDQINETKRP
jgi:hypothetical protein